ncbi:MAG: hypothetical protein AAF682_29390 [Planctomycetota bacterium]
MVVNGVSTCLHDWVVALGLALLLALPGHAAAGGCGAPGGSAAAADLAVEGEALSCCAVPATPAPPPCCCTPEPEDADSGGPDGPRAETDCGCALTPAGGGAPLRTVEGGSAVSPVRRIANAFAQQARLAAADDATRTAGTRGAPPDRRAEAGGAPAAHRSGPERLHWLSIARL